MTVCVYLNHKNKHYLGADSLLVCGDFKSRYSNYSKIVRLDGGFAAWAGNSTRITLPGKKTAPFFGGILGVICTALK